MTTNYAYAQISSNEDESSYSLVAVSSDANPNQTSQKNSTKIISQENDSKQAGVESSRNNTVDFNLQETNKTSNLFNKGAANVTSGNGASVHVATEVNGDFNGDGFEDKAIGVPYEDVGSITDVGVVHVIYGSRSGLSTTTVLTDELITQDSLGPIVISEPDDLFGWSLTSGDFNGDGKDDLAIGTPGEDFTWGFVPVTDGGAVYITYGSTSGLSSDDGLSNQFWVEGRDIQGGFPQNSTGVGHSLSSGDFNGDGKDDLAIGVPHRDIEGGPNGNIINDAGLAHVIYGSSDGVDILHDQVWRQGIGNIADEPEFLDYFGWSLTSGDFNGDGKDDLAIGVPDEGEGLSHSTCDIQVEACTSVVHVIYGSSLGLSTTSPVEDQLWVQGAAGLKDFGEGGDSFGDSLTSGDFNGDGKDDLAIGVPGENIPGNVPGDVIFDVGKVHVIYGSSSGLSTTSPVEDQLFMQGVGGLSDVAELQDSFGDSLTSGDFNGDGKDDLAIGVPGENVVSETVPDVGKVHVIYGSSSGLSTTSPVEDQLFMQGVGGLGDVAEGGDFFGTSLSSGNFNGDKINGHSIDDLAIGVPHEKISSETLRDVGKIHVIYGSSSGLSSTSPPSPLEANLWQQGQDNLDDVAEEGDFFGLVQ